MAFHIHKRIITQHAHCNFILVPYLRTTMEHIHAKGKKMIPYLRTQDFKNHTLYLVAHTYIVHIWEYPPGAISVYVVSSFIFYFKVKRWM